MLNVIMTTLEEELQARYELFLFFLFFFFSTVLSKF
jgi:hypothetical protein